MATLLKGAGPDLIIHEWMHSWYQGVLATNESLYPWMDEGLPLCGGKGADFLPKTLHFPRMII